MHNNEQQQKSIQKTENKTLYNSLNEFKMDLSTK